MHINSLTVEARTPHNPMERNGAISGKRQDAGKAALAADIERKTYNLSVTLKTPERVFFYPPGHRLPMSHLDPITFFLKGLKHNPIIGLGHELAF